MSTSRLLAYRPWSSALLAAGLATATLGITGLIAVGHGAGGEPGSSAALVEAYNDGFIDGRADAMGDDNRDGIVSEGESGWGCRVVGNGGCGVRVVPAECAGAGAAVDLCVTVSGRPPYGWTNPDGSRVDNPDGLTQVRDLDETPGTAAFAAALRSLDAEWRNHH
ncbi:hypothetical protein [Streptomyces sp. bgisy060]|uniref:hypothetical protein n=1 Tax=Streptomyces sp. bgisy060 TaxID=3413775 RepID=UPI003EBAFAC7